MVAPYEHSPQKEIGAVNARLTEAGKTDGNAYIDRGSGAERTRRRGLLPEVL